MIPRIPILLPALAALSLAAACLPARAQLPSDGLVSKTFYDTSKVRFDGIMWFEEIPGKPGYFLVAEQNGKIWTFQPATLSKLLYMKFPAYFPPDSGYYED